MYNNFLKNIDYLKGVMALFILGGKFIFMTKNNVNIFYLKKNSYNEVY